MPALNQRLRVWLHVQRHIGPQHVHRLRWRLKLRASAQPAFPPALLELLARTLRLRRAAFLHKALRLRVAPHQLLVYLPATLQGTPMQPAGGCAHNPLQPLFHAARHLLMQPG